MPIGHYSGESGGFPVYGIKGGETRNETKEPLIDDEGWEIVRNYNASDLETRDQRADMSKGRKREYLGHALKLDG